MIITFKMSCSDSVVQMFEEFKNGSNYIFSREELERVLSTSKNTRVKKKMCSYFIWLNENRKGIEKEYFSDFYNIEDWSIENKKKYFESKGLKSDNIVKNGRPRIASLITTKAGKIYFF